METYFPYNVDNPQTVTGERHEIKDGMIRLRHIPKAGTLHIDGFTEVNSPVNLQSNQFFCYYAADSLYREANRLVYFYRGLGGQRVTCNYLAIGTPITAEDMNEIKEHLDKGGDDDSEINARIAQLANKISEVDRSARTIIVEHDKSISAHADIRKAIADITIDPELVAKVDALSSAVESLEGADENIFAVLESLSRADEDISAEIDALNRLTDELDDKLAGLSGALRAEINSRRAADVMITNFIIDINESISGLSATVAELTYNVDDLDQQLADEERARKSADTALSNRISLLETTADASISALSLAIDTLHDEDAIIWGRIANLADADIALTEQIAALSKAIDGNIAERLDALSSAVNLSISALSAALYDEQIARISADTNLDARITELEKKIDGEEPVEPTVNEIIFNNKPHAGYSPIGKADFLTYVFGDDTPTPYSASGASAFIDYIF